MTKKKKKKSTMKEDESVLLAETVSFIENCLSKHENFEKFNHDNTVLLRKIVKSHSKLRDIIPLKGGYNFMESLSLKSQHQPTHDFG